MKWTKEDTAVVLVSSFVTYVLVGLLTTFYVWGIFYTIGFCFMFHFVMKTIKGDI